MHEKKDPRHPSWVAVSFSRISGQRTFFNSSVQSSSWVRLSVTEAERYSSFGHDRVQGSLRGTLIEVDMSPAQFAELITTMNVGSGVPGTMVYFDGKQIERYEEMQTEVNKVQQHFKERMHERAADFVKKSEEIQAIFADKKTVSKADREAVMELMASMVQELRSNVPFYLEQFNESAGKIVVQAKAEVEAFVTKAVTDTGLEQLRSGAPRMQTLLPEPKDES